jgi:AbrB family looped-hinge helix DNA binding protein
MQKEKENKYDDFFKESNIIKLEDKKFILNCLPNKPNKTKLLYDSKIHGDKANTFHSKCDGKFPTNITMLEKDGKYIFGVVKVGDKGQIVIPRDARKVYDIKPGDALLLLGDQRGMALVKTEIFQSAIDQVMEGLPK